MVKFSFHSGWPVSNQDSNQRLSNRKQDFWLIRSEFQYYCATAAGATTVITATTGGLLPLRVLHVNVLIFRHLVVNIRDTAKQTCWIFQILSPT
jgi:hypothetical protein